MSAFPMAPEFSSSFSTHALLTMGSTNSVYSEIQQDNWHSRQDWRDRVLTTGPPGKSQEENIFKASIQDTKITSFATA